MRCPYCDGKGNLAHPTVGAMILAMRQTRKLTQQALCVKVGLSRAQIANIESGRSDIPIKTLAKFAAAFKCSMKDLVP